VGKNNTMEPRRVIDLKMLNNASIRQTHHTQPAFQQIEKIPDRQYKSCCDCWNGYHSVVVRKEDRHYLTFITPWGRYRYCSAPQGWMASGDAYTQRFDKISSSFKNVIKQVDDSLLYHSTIAGSLNLMSEYLHHLGKHGIVINPDKLQLAQETVKFAGFQVSMSRISPLPVHIDAIKEFPAPRNSTDIRSFFALLDQVAYAYSVKEHLLTFRDLLKKETKFYWDENLQKLFDDCKSHIAEQVERGIRSFDHRRVTCLATDWCKDGIGYWLLQKYCRCTDITPICCKDGWKLCLVGSRFCIPAETRYSPTEGELLVVADALKKTRFLTLGCSNLIIATDHKPLLRILNDKPNFTINNPRLSSIAEKCTTHRFKIIHIPGKKLCGPDALSRYMSPLAESSETNSTRHEILQCIRHITMETPDFEMMDPEITEEIMATHSVVTRAVTWPELSNICASDKTVLDLCNMIISGFPKKKNLLPTHLQQFWRVRYDMTIVQGVPMYKEDRSYIPTEMRPRVLEILHSAHQGVTNMNVRAETCVYWPGIKDNIVRIRGSCNSCDESAPSQSNMSPVTPVLPEYPFQHVVADYFHLNGFKYLVYADRFSGWTSIANSQSSTASEIIRNMCDEHGLPDTLSSDGGPEFTSGRFKQLLSDYGIFHRISSAYNPHSNCRAEIAVKLMKRLIGENVSSFGSLDNAKITTALPQHRNTPDRDTGLSPAQLLLGRNLKDFLPTPPGRQKLGLIWKKTLETREVATPTEI